MDPSGPFWGAHPTEKDVHTKAHPPENFRLKMTWIWIRGDFGPRWGAKRQKCLKPFNQGPILSEIDL